MAKRRVKSQIGNLTPESWPLKVKNRPDFLTCRWRVTYHWKAFDKHYNFSLDLISIDGLHTKLWTPKVLKIPTVGISGFPLGSPKTKWHLGAGPVAMHRIYYKGEGGEPCESEFAHDLSQHQKCSSCALTNLLFGFVQIRVSEWLLVILPSPIPELQHAPLPPKCYKPGSVTQLFTFPLFSSQTHIWIY